MQLPLSLFTNSDMLGSNQTVTEQPMPPAILTHPSTMPHRSSPVKINLSQMHNRILALMAHTTRYAFKGGTRLAADAGVSKSAVCRLLNGQSSPSFALVLAITKALEKHLHRPLDPRDLISLDGHYPTASACQLAGCKGCLPPEAYDENNILRPEFKDIKPGQWSLTPRLFLAKTHPHQVEHHVGQQVEQAEEGR